MQCDRYSRCRLLVVCTASIFRDCGCLWLVPVRSSPFDHPFTHRWRTADSSHCELYRFLTALSENLPALATIQPALVHFLQTHPRPPPTEHSLKRHFQNYSAAAVAVIIHKNTTDASHGVVDGESITRENGTKTYQLHLKRLNTADLEAKLKRITDTLDKIRNTEGTDRVDSSLAPHDDTNPSQPGAKIFEHSGHPPWAQSDDEDEFYPGESGSGDLPAETEPPMSATTESDVVVVVDEMTTVPVVLTARPPSVVIHDRFPPRVTEDKQKGSGSGAVVTFNENRLWKAIMIFAFIIARWLLWSVDGIVD
ncbi:unnamed protein product [Soboliphyme baturini]|uniref:Transmembrane protein n=1 Tax=Soboliphyme baturini TaxID=241478 RepID=A0A183IFS4_9BILA|nr:unnamed protein product [Soboliphyme baturini]